jgi:hypothetical protein
VGVSETGQAVAVALLSPRGVVPSVVNCIELSIIYLIGKPKKVVLVPDFSILTVTPSIVAVEGIANPKFVATRASDICVLFNDTEALLLSLAVTLPGLDQAIPVTFTLVPVPALFGPAVWAVIAIGRHTIRSNMLHSNFRLVPIASKLNKYDNKNRNNFYNIKNGSYN